MQRRIVVIALTIVICRELLCHGAPAQKMVPDGKGHASVVETITLEPIPARLDSDSTIPLTVKNLSDSTVSLSVGLERNTSGKWRLIANDAARPKTRTADPTTCSLMGGCSLTLMFEPWSGWTEHWAPLLRGGETVRFLARWHATDGSSGEICSNAFRVPARRNRNSAVYRGSGWDEIKATLARRTPDSRTIRGDYIGVTTDSIHVTVLAAAAGETTVAVTLTNRSTMALPVSIEAQSAHNGCWRDYSHSIDLDDNSGVLKPADVVHRVGRGRRSLYSGT